MKSHQATARADRVVATTSPVSARGVATSAAPTTSRLTDNAGPQAALPRRPPRRTGLDRLHRRWGALAGQVPPRVVPALLLLPFLELPLASGALLRQPPRLLGVGAGEVVRAAGQPRGEGRPGLLGAAAAHPGCWGDGWSQVGPDPDDDEADGAGTDAVAGTPEYVSQGGAASSGRPSAEPSGTGDGRGPEAGAHGWWSFPAAS